MSMRISFNANSERLGDQEDQFAEQMIRLAPPWLTLVRWNFALAERIYEGTGKRTKIIMRFPTGSEKTEWRGGREYANATITAWAKLNRPHLYYNVLNEPTWNGPGELRAMLDYLIYFMDTAALNGVHCVVLNGGADNKESVEAGQWDDFLRALDRHAGFHYLGVHEYAAPSMPSSHNHPAEWLLDPERVQPGWNPVTEKGGWPRPDQMSTDLVGGRYPDIATICRGNWFDIRARQLGLRPPRRVVTEFGWDNLPNISWVYQKLREQYGVPPEFEYLGIHGPLTLEHVWRAYWKDWSFDEAAIEQLKWADEVYPENVEGLCLYYCTKEPEWADYNFLRTGIAERLIALKPAPEPPPPPEPEPPPAPKPAFNLTHWLLGALVVILALGVGAWLYSNFYFLRGFSAEEASNVADFLTDLFARIDVLAYLPFTAAVVLYLTEVLKRLELRLPEQYRVHPRVIGLTLTVLAWAGYAVANRFGYGLAYEQTFGIVEGFVKVLGPILLGTVVTSSVAQYAHNRLQAKRVTPFNSRWPKAA